MFESAQARKINAILW